MRILAFSFLALLVQSCFVIHVHPTSETLTLTSKKAPHTKRMMHSGKTAVIGGQTHDILFYDAPLAPQNDFVFIADSLPSKKGKMVLRVDGRALHSKDQNANSAEQQPLIVIDGVVQTDPLGLNAIDPDTIATVNVLKDGAALKKYGAQGKNGVVEITTKK
jgi:TonB-dependent SusC/RagA subfamily outer membrane receptor